MSSFIGQNEVILFQGDSITDGARNKDNAVDLGHGYPYILAAKLGHLYPEKCLQFYNRGISGNRVPNLQARWQQDCLDIKPTIVSI